MNPPISDVTVSIVSHGQGDLVRRLLGDLSQLNVSEVIVTLNIPEQEDFLRTFPGSGITVIRNPLVKGFGANHNAAFTLCRTPWFVVLNPDLRLPHDPFTSLLRAARARPDMGVIAPGIVNAGGHREDSVRANPTPLSVAARIFDRRQGQADAHSADFYWLAGMFMMFSSTAFRRIGGFDERFFLYYEDYDVCVRLRRAGFAIAVDSSALVVHEARRDSRRSWRHLKWHVASLLRVWTSRNFWLVLLNRSRAGMEAK